jgi:cobalt/nickel transport system permease protein
VGYTVYAGTSRLANGRLWLRQAGAFTAAWLTVQAGALLTAFELAVSDTSPLSVVLPSMMGVHALIGIGEGLITVAALSLVATTRRDLLPTEVALSEE